MALQSAIDYFGQADTELALKSSSENRTASSAEATNARGDFIARDVYGERYAPTATYELKAALSKAIALGSVNTPADLFPVVLNKLSIKTKAGMAPSLEFGGESIQEDGTVSSTIALGTVAVSVRHKAQILFAAFTLAGTGCELNECNADCSCKISRGEVNGDTLSHDVSEGVIKVTATIVQSGATAPTVTAGTGFDITSPLTCEDPDSEYRTWKIELTKSLTGTDPV